MYPYHWTWTYTFLAIGFVIGVLLVLFVLAGVVLLLRSGRRRQWHRSPRSIATPLGCESYWTQETMKMASPGVARARQREYYNPRGQR